MLKSEAAAYLAGVTQIEGAEASAPTNLHVITGEVGEMSEDGKALVKIDGLMFSESDDQYIEIDALGGLEEGDIATLILTGEQGHAMTPLALGSIGSIDRITVRISEIEADYIKVEQLEAATARIGELEADHVSVDDLDAAEARIGTLETTRATITDLEAAEARIGTLESDHVSTDDLDAATARIGTLETNTADIGTIRANSAKVQNLTAAQLEADHATVGSLSTNYAHITNGVIDNATIGYADVNNLSAHYAEIQNGKIDSALINTAEIVDEQVFTVTGNKATLAQIDASKINVLNLKAKDIEVERINGQPVTNKTLVDALTQHESDISDLDSKIDDEVEALNERIDGAIETFTGTVVPTLNNTPASQWNTVALKDQHVGDVYYVVNSQSAQNGYCYRFTKSGSTYSWQLIKDSDVTAALSRLQTAEGKISNIETFDETVGSFMTNTEDEISSLKTKDTQLETSLGDKVSTSTFNTVSQKVDTNEANITSMSTVLTNNGLTSSTNITNTVNTVKQTADTNKASITSLTQTVNNKADGSTVTTLTNRVSTVEQNLSGITTRVGKTESELDTVSNPNLTPYFSRDKGDVYNASTNPSGYWKNISADYITTLDDGWVHISASNSGTSNLFVNYFTAKTSVPKDLAASTKYTFLVETRGVTKSGNVVVYASHHLGSELHAFTSSAGYSVSGEESKYFTVTSASDLSSIACFTRGYIQVPSKGSVDMDIRISLYEGEYSGPYKPYVDQTLSNRVKSAETAIEQNADAIALRATKTEASQMAQPNLSPYFQSTPMTTDGGYWLYFANSYASFTPTGDGWCRIVLDNKRGTGVKRCDFDMDACPSVEPGKDYTLLYEVRNLACSGSGAQTYVVQAGNELNRGIQFWGNSAHTLLQGHGTNCVVNYINTASGSGGDRAELCDDGIYRKRVVRKSEASDSTYYTRATDKELMRLVAYANAGAYIDVELRVSLYPGVYTGPYKPYSGAQLYASQSELKVANDNINLKVSKNDVINQINVSTEGVKIQASKVEIDGTAVFSAISSDVDDAITSKGYQTSSQVNSAITSKGYATTTQAQGYATTAENSAKAYTDALEIGGRNLLKASDVLVKPTSYEAYDIYVAEAIESGQPYILQLWDVDVSHSAKTAAQLGVNVYYCGGSVALGGWIGTNYFTNGHADRLTLYFTAYTSGATVNSGGNINGSANALSHSAVMNTTKKYIRLYNSVPTAEGTRSMSVGSWKLEKGNKATDWSPAPEDLASAVDSVEYIAGTQTAATGSWTGVTRDSSLYTGKTIAYKLPYAGSGNASLQLTDSSGNNVGGNIAVYSMTTRVTTHYPAGSVIQMTYDGTYWRTAGWYNSNNYDRNLHNNYIKAAANVVSGQLVCGTSAGYKPIAASATFDMSYPILWAGGAWTSGTQYANAYETYPGVNPATTATVQGIAVNKMVYIKGQISGNTFTCAASNFLTCTVPSSEDGYFYLPVGIVANDATTKMYFNTSNDLYAYLDGKFRQVTPTEIMASQRIYYRSKVSGTVPKPTAWVTLATNKYNDTVSVGNSGWSTKVTPIASSTAENVTKYLYLYTCEQRKRLDGTVECTAVTLDENTTIIDGGNIITHTVTADQLNAASINASKTLTVGAMTDAAASTILNSNIEIGGRNLLFQTSSFSGSGTSTSYFIEYTVNNGALKNSVALEAGVEYTFSADVTSSREPFQMTIGVGTGSYSRDISHGPGETLTSGHISITFKPTAAQLANGAIFAFRAPRYGTQGTSFTYAVAHPKLEKGNKATDWTPAPEDQEALALSSGIEYIAGTQAEATNVWTGVTKETALVAGKTIAYHLPFAGTSTAATLTLTLANGSTTAAIGIKFNTNNSAANNVTTHYGAGSVINMTYDGTYWRVAAGYYDTDGINNALYRTRNPNAIKAVAACTSGHIICGTSSGYRNLAANVLFDLNYALMYCGTSIAANATGTNNYLTYNAVNVTTSGTVESVTQYATVYLKGTVDGKTFKISASPFLTCKVPTSDDGFAYIPLGIAYNKTPNIYFNSSSDVYAFRNGAFQKLDSVSKYITAITDSGIRVHAKTNPTTNYAAIDADGMDVVKGGVSVAQFGEDNGNGPSARIGKEASAHATISASEESGTGESGVGYTDSISDMTLYDATGDNPDLRLYNKSTAWSDGNNSYEVGMALGRDVYASKIRASIYEGEDPSSNLEILTGDLSTSVNAGTFIGSQRHWASDSSKFDKASVETASGAGGGASVQISAMSGNPKVAGAYAGMSVKATSSGTDVTIEADEIKLYDNQQDSYSSVYITHGMFGQTTETSANSYKDFTVTFGHEYTSAPHVVVGFYSTSTAAALGGMSCAVHSITNTGCKVRVFNNTSSARSPGFEWIAIG